MSGRGSAYPIVMEIHDAFRRSEYFRMAALYARDIEWQMHASPSIFPVGGQRRGKSAVFLMLLNISLHYRFDHYEIDDVVAEGDWAAVVADVSITQRKTGRVIRCRAASFNQVRDGKVVAYRGFIDSFDAAEQMLGRIIAP
ncbi:nuclear transport factor 2 family protein [Undibacter mobilis]|uniref:Nuclear transport factor 2 family protein n=1 Tax=Undibacter mobilis TaxID=2292256 RepID=A0A371B2L3_9BRAD|nr:nuclear transport factor 2 family protein [Undibacter mobilis]RDV01790.1 nuclear transport factor 2 family protein [Undibacter mobilis]